MAEERGKDEYMAAELDTDDANGLPHLEPISNIHATASAHEQIPGRLASLCSQCAWPWKSMTPAVVEGGWLHLRQHKRQSLEQQ